MHEFIPHTVEPYSFNGNGWLFALNLWLMTAVAALMAGLVKWQIKDAWRHRDVDRFGSAAFIYRSIGILVGCGITLRCAAEAIKLWGWSPDRPDATFWALQVKPFVDPISLLFGVCGMALFALGLPGMMMQLRRKPPLPLRWPRREDLRGPSLIVICTAGMTAALVLMR